MTHEPTRTPTYTLESSLALMVATELGGLIDRLVNERIRAATTPEPASMPALPPPNGARWVTPPEASRVTGVPVKAIRGFIRDRRIEVRLKNVASNPKQPKYLVNVDEVVRVATVPTRPSYPATRMPNAGSRPAQARPDEWARARIAPADGR